jgi:outer membrane receptor protein involved in Fe transport
MQRFCAWHLFTPRAVRAWLLVLLLCISAAGGAARGRGEGLPPKAVTGKIDGAVTDQAGASVVGAGVALQTPGGVGVLRADTDAQGRFRFEAVAAGSYVLVVEKSGFEQARQLLSVAPGQSVSLHVHLGVRALMEAVTVTPARGEAREVFETPEAVSVTAEQELSRRARLILPQALREEPGVHVQQTTTSQGSPFIRGLTGQQVVSLVDGLRFNNSTFRPGANQYTAFIDPSFVSRLEVVRGPNSTQYGSDALGGTLNVLTRPTGIGPRSFELHGQAETFFTSADLAAGGAARLSGGAKRWGFLAEAAGRRAQDLRAGRGLDSHSVATRLLGISSKALGSRLQDTAYTQYGAHAKFAARPTDADELSFEYLRGAQLGVRRYDQLDGGLGNLLNRFDPQTLDFASARYTRAGLGLLDSVTLAFSYNGQRDDRTSQSVNNATTGLRSRVTDEYNRTDAFGYQAQATTRAGRHSLVFGGELYDEFITSRRTDARFSNATGGFTDVAVVRARFPDGARYRTLGLFVQDVARLVPERLTATFGLRYSRFNYRQSPEDNPLDARGQPTVPAFRTSAGDVTFNAGVAFALTRSLGLTANVSRGFRAPNVNDFGSIGLSGIGFEVTPEEGERLGALVGNFDASQPAGGAARPVRQLAPETLYNYEGGVRLRAARVSATASVYDAEFTNFIERRVLLLPQGALGSTVGGQQVVRQDASGAVYTSLSSAPVFVRANAGHDRLRGVEASLMLNVTRSVSFNAHAFYVRGTNTETGAPPSLENGIPPVTGFAGLRWEPAGRRFWVETYTHFAGAQTRLSDNDLQQARIGGVRTREEITNFFNNGAAARGLVRGGVLLETGERLPEVLRRVLGPDLSARVPLFLKNPGFATFNVRGGYRLGERSNVTVILENVFDKNYRTMGSGVDAPGLNAVVSFSRSF